MFTVMDKMIWRDILCMKYLTIFIFCLLVIIPYSLQAANLPKEQVSTNLKNSSFLDKIILNCLIKRRVRTNWDRREKWGDSKEADRFCQLERR